MLNHQRYGALKSALERLESWLKNTECVNSILEVLMRFHVLLGHLLEHLTERVPVVCLIFTGMGHLATLFRPEKLTPKALVSSGVKLVSGLGMVLMGIMGIVFPSMGIGYVALGFGFGLGRSCYKAWRTMKKLAQAENAALHLSHAMSKVKHEQTPLVVNEAKVQAQLRHQAHKWPHRVLDVAVTALCCAALAVAAWVPGMQVFGIAFFTGVNCGYSVYRSREHIGAFFQPLVARVRNMVSPDRTVPTRPQPVQVAEVEHEVDAVSDEWSVTAETESIALSDEDEEREGDGDAALTPQLTPNEKEVDAVTSFLAQEDAVMKTVAAHHSSSGQHSAPAAVTPVNTPVANKAVDAFLQQEQAILSGQHRSEHLAVRKAQPSDDTESALVCDGEEISLGEHESMY